MQCLKPQLAGQSPSPAAMALRFGRLCPLSPLSFPSPRHRFRPIPFRPLAMRKRNPKRLKYASERIYKGGDKMAYVDIDPSEVDKWKLEPVVELIRKGGVGVIPTDTVYAIVCDARNHSSIERLRRIKGIEKTKPLSILCHSLRDIDTYTTGFPKGTDHGQINIFKAVRHFLPGPYTFILPASKALPKQCIRHGTIVKFETRKNVGVRLPDDAICQAILEMLDGPLISTSVKWPSEDQWMLDPVQIAEIYEAEGIDFIVGGGVRTSDPSTVVDMTGNIPKIIRQGKGPKYDWMEDQSEDKATGSENLTVLANIA